jgi:hypothetical protein
MKRYSSLYLAMGVIWMTALAAPAQPIGVSPNATPAPTTLPGEDKIIPEVAFNNATLETVVDFLRKSLPGFNAVIVRDNGVPADYPTISNLKLRDVGVGQLMEFIRTSYPGISLDRIAGPAGPLYVIRVSNFGPYGGAVGIPGPIGMNGAPQAPGAPLPEQSFVQVYKLTDIVNTLAASKPDNMTPEQRTKGAMDDVLSLLQAALDQTEGPNVVLKVHEPTQVLMFKGTPQKSAVVQQVLSTLQPNPNDEQMKFRQQMDAMRRQRDDLENVIAQLKRDQDQLHAREQEQRAQLEQSKVENAVLRAQLEQVKAEAERAKSGGK